MALLIFHSSCIGYVLSLARAGIPRNFYTAPKYFDMTTHSQSFFDVPKEQGGHHSKTRFSIRFFIRQIDKRVFF